MKLVRFIIKRLVTWYYNRTHFLSFSWSLDENSEIYIQSAEYSDTGYRYGVHEVTYEQVTGKLPASEEDE